MTRTIFARSLVSFGIASAALRLSSLPGNAQVVRMLKNLSGETITGNRADQYAIDDAGRTIYAVGSSNQYGANPEFRRQIFRWDAASGAGSQITNLPLDIASVSVSDDGQWIAFASNGNVSGANPDESYELFVMHPDGTQIRQVTSATSRVGSGVTTAAIAGSGNRIVFTADSDPLGSNPGHTPHFFSVDRDGANLVQLAAASGPRDVVAAAISDDGSRVVYFACDPGNTSARIYASPSDGSTAPALIATVPACVRSIALSGNGQVAAFDSTDGTIGKVNWDGTGLISPLALGEAPSVTDDGATVFYVSSGGVRKIGSDGSGGALVAASSPPLRYGGSLISGDGSRIAVVGSGGPIPGGSNADGGAELIAMDAAGGNLVQLTRMSVWPASHRADDDAPTVARILTDGTRVYFVSDGNPLGTNADHSVEVFTMLSDGTGLAQVTHLTGASVNTLSVSDAGIIVYESYGGDGNIQFYKVGADGTGPTQLTQFDSGPSYGRFPIVRFDGQLILYEGTNASGVFGLHTMPIDGGAVTTIAPVDGSPTFHYRMSTTPITDVVYDGPSNGDGQNPNHLFQIQRVGINGTGYRRITADPTYDSLSPDISGDGSKIVWYSQADFTGQNPDHGYEVFLYDVPTAAMKQLSNTTGGTGATSPAITRDGSWVYFDQNADVLRVSVATGEVQRVTGFSPQRASLCDVDGTGTKALFAGQGVIHQSPGATSLFLADQSAKPEFHIGKSAPTLLDWDADPQSLTFDVIRGDLANLATLGGTVSLDPVTGLECDSLDNTTLGNEDATQPDPGHGFFYLYRGTVGSPAVNGSWGQGTGALERVSGTGTCNVQAVPLHLDLTAGYWAVFTGWTDAHFPLANHDGYLSFDFLSESDETKPSWGPAPLCTHSWSCHSMQYLYQPATHMPATNISKYEYLRVTVSVDTHGTIPVFHNETERTCQIGVNFPDHSPATVSVVLNTYPSSARWWSEPATRITPGTTIITVPLQPHYWNDEFGALGDSTQALRDEFAGDLLNLADISLSFGGACGDGHGVYITPVGTLATLTLQDYEIVP